MVLGWGFRLLVGAVESLFLHIVLRKISGTSKVVLGWGFGGLRRDCWVSSLIKLYSHPLGVRVGVCSLVCAVESLFSYLVLSVCKSSGTSKLEVQA